MINCWSSSTSSSVRDGLINGAACVGTGRSPLCVFYLTVSVVISPWQTHAINHIHWCRPTHDPTPDTSISKSLASCLVMASNSTRCPEALSSLLHQEAAEPGWNSERSQHSMIKSESCSYRCYLVQAESCWVWTCTNWPLLRFWGKKMKFMRISQFLALDNLPLWAIFKTPVISTKALVAIYVQYTYGCIGLRWMLQLAGREVRSGGSGGWCCIRRQQCFAQGRAYVSPLMSHHHILYDETLPCHPGCWMPLPLYVSGDNHVSRWSPSETWRLCNASIWPRHWRKTITVSVFDAQSTSVRLD